MRVRIVSYENVDGWILGKFAKKLDENLRDLGVVSEIGKSPHTAADINHHISYIEYDGSINNIDTLMITHVDTIKKVNEIRSQLKTATGICMSKESLDNLVNAGLPADKLCYINPAHDNVIKRRKTVVGIFSRVYKDGRKREHFIDSLSDMISNDIFAFRIMGNGWDKQAAVLRDKGFEVEFYSDFIYDEYVKLIPTLDYYLYTGLDEGQMGFIDALAAGIKTIVPPIGYHLDVSDGITHPFKELDELIQIFSDIEKECNRYPSLVENWTWRDYAKKHVELWQYLIQQKEGNDKNSVLSDYPDGINSLVNVNGAKPTPKTIANEYRKLITSSVSGRKKIENLVLGLVPFSVFKWYRKVKK